MAISVSSVDTTSGTDSANQTTYTTASFTPTADRLLIAVFSTRDDATRLGQPTVSGGSLTWTLITDGTTAADSAYNTASSENSRVVAFWADTGGSPGSMTLVFDGVGATLDSACWSIYEVDGTDIDANVFVQVVTNRGDGATSGSFTLAAFADSANRPFGFVLVWDGLKCCSLREKPTIVRLSSRRKSPATHDCYYGA